MSISRHRHTYSFQAPYNLGLKKAEANNSHNKRGVALLLGQLPAFGGRQVLILRLQAADYLRRAGGRGGVQPEVMKAQLYHHSPGCRSHGGRVFQGDIRKS